MARELFGIQLLRNAYLFVDLDTLVRFQSRAHLAVEVLRVQELREKTRSSGDSLPRPLKQVQQNLRLRRAELRRIIRMRKSKRNTARVDLQKPT